MNSELVVKLNELAINDGQSGLFLDGQIEGLGLPEIRTSSGNLSGQDGGYVGAQFYAGRIISLTGRAFATDVATVEDLRATLLSTLATKRLTFRMVTYAGRSWVMECNVLKAEMPIENQLNRAPFAIQLYAPDPVIYDDTAGGLLTATINRVTKDGFTWPITWPISWGSVTGPTTVTNSGNVTVYPQVFDDGTGGIRLTGVMNDLVLTNETTGEVFSFDGLTTSPGDEVVIDMLNHTVTLNGGTIFEKVAPGSQWWGLVPGPNTITLDSASGSDDVTATIEWRSGVMGI